MSEARSSRVRTADGARPILNYTVYGASRQRALLRTHHFALRNGCFMHRVLLLGAGKIGRMIARFLMDSGDYDVLVGDVSAPALDRIAKLTGASVTRVDATDGASIASALKGRQTVISALSFHHNAAVARAALAS